MFHFEMNIRKGEMDFLKFNISVFNSLERFLPVRKYDPMTQFPAREENNYFHKAVEPVNAGVGQKRHIIV